MDEPLSLVDTVIFLVDFTGQDLDKWFELLCDAYNTSPDWAEFQATLTETAKRDISQADATLEDFLKYLDDRMDRMDVLKEMADIGADNLVRRYQEILVLREQAAAESAAEHQAAGIDESAWFAHLARFDKYWDGSDGSWDNFKSMFLADPTFVANARVVIEAAEAGNKVEILRRYGITPYDVNMWLAHVQAADGLWDGAEQRWPAFRATFLADGGSKGVDKPSAVLLDFAEKYQQGKVAALALYRIGIRSAPPQGTTEQFSLDQVIDTALGNAVARVPGANALPAELLQNIHAEIFEEVGDYAVQ